jgi:hypothetical protein
VQAVDWAVRSIYIFLAQTWFCFHICEFRFAGFGSLERWMKVSALLLMAFSCALGAQQFTRGIGVYPGDPREYTGPTLSTEAQTYRNLALHRPAYQSSAYDYNLTAQLITDGIKQTELPRWITTSTSDGGLLGKRQREIFLDGNETSMVEAHGPNPWVEFDLEGGGATPELDRIDLSLRNIWAPAPQGGWSYTVLGSDDRVNWKEVGRAHGANWPQMNPDGASFTQTVLFHAPAHNRSYRIQLMAAGVTSWGVAEAVLYDRNHEVRVAGAGIFDSAWMSAGSGAEWVSVDLGADCTFDRIVLNWIRRAAEGVIETSDDNVNWKTIHPLSAKAGMNEEIHLTRPAHGRYLRVRMIRPAEPEGRYILSEVEVWGRGGPVATAKPAASVRADGRLPLAGGEWKLERASQVSFGGEQISKVGFHDNSWMVATVPGTVLTSYLNDGAIANPDYGDNQYAVSDSFFCADFWYRDEFIAPAAPHGQHRWLNLDGINWKAEIYLNGERIGRIDGGYMRGSFDVTALLHSGAANALAIRIIANDNPGSTKDKAGDTVNGGALGRDNPTYHASAGWDWMSTIRGRNTGILHEVSLTSSGPVTIESPLVTTTLPLPDTTHADVTIQATMRNLEAHAVSGILRARFGAITVEEPVKLDASSEKLVEFSPAKQAILHLTNPKLWWPVGYGDPNLYQVTLTFLADGKTSDTTSFQAGVRQFTYSEEGGILKIWINGRRFIAKGGNWGFPESMLRYRAREYETALRYHRDQHFNMIRNWVGQTGDEAFYEAADRNGVVIWQEFWLANPWDGPNPDNNAFFLTVAKDYMLRIRNHASLGLFCGRNEGYPPKPLDDGFRSLVSTLRPGSHYISNSAKDPVSGGGPYRVEPLKFYFEHAPVHFHSEIGSPNVPELDSFQRTMPEADLWPAGESPWMLHDFYPENPFKDAVDRDYGGASNIADWVNLAQFVNYNSYRGMFEGQSKNRYGILIWMSHPAWPSLLWQTYDYFYDTDAGYYGAKKACEPLHIQWNAATDRVEVVNYSAGNLTGLTAKAEVLDLDGKVKWTRTATVDSREDSTVTPITMEYPASLGATHFIRLTLFQAGKTAGGTRTLSTNFYMRGVPDENYRAIRGLAEARVEAQTSRTLIGSRWTITTTLRNVSATPALMVRVKVVREKSGDPILPALYDDNYIALMPGERRTIVAHVENADTRGEGPRTVVKGYNLAARP